MSECVLETRHITKSFGTNIVLTDVNFECRTGEIHALVGENGAGKSTLMKILSGVYKQTSGEVFMNGNPVSFKTTLEAQNAGISIIHQEFNLIPYLSVAENVFLGNLPLTKTKIIDYIGMEEIVRNLAEEMGIEIDPTTLVENLSVAQQQMVEIMKALNLKTKIIIMDEPTAALTQVEVGALFRMMRKMRAENKTLIYISHRLNEIFEISDRITVLMDGKITGTRLKEETTKDEIVTMMVGRVVENIFPERDHYIRGNVVLQADELVTQKGCQGASFSLYEGEILGVSGLEGQGQRELIRCLFGLQKPLSGTIKLKGKTVSIPSPMKAVKMGISFLTDDRKQEGLCLDLPIYDNTSLPILNKLAKHGILLSAYEKQNSNYYMKLMNIRALNSTQTVRSLSGGNQQKVLLGKCFSFHPSILLAHDPTRGIDVGAKVEIYKLLKKLAREDKLAIMMVSSDLMEILNVSDRIIVIHNSRVNGEIAGKDANEEILMKMATNVISEVADGKGA